MATFIIEGFSASTNSVAARYYLVDVNGEGGIIGRRWRPHRAVCLLMIYKDSNPGVEIPCLYLQLLARTCGIKEVYILHESPLY